MMKIDEIHKSSSSKCYECNKLCCKYITVKIAAPRTIRDFDGLLWQLSHENVEAFRDYTGWYLIIYNSCSHLMAGGECRIYRNRPITCREHSHDECEDGNPISKTAVQYFSDYKSLNNYCKKKFKTWDKRF